MKLSDFDYELPEELIAQYPEPERGQSRLLSINCQEESFTDRQFSDLDSLLNPGDLLVLNDTRVIPARMYGQKETGGQVELLLERIVSEKEFLSQIRASKSPKAGAKILIDDQVALEILNKQDDLYQVRLLLDGTILTFLEQHGHMPLPPYIDRDDESLDLDRYQTVYAREPGAVAAPTAGLHFSRDHLQRLAGNGVQHVYVTLHVGAGTFQPVRVDDIEQHEMHHEWFNINELAVKAIKEVKARGNRVIAVGTTSLRTLEAAASEQQLQAMQAETNLFIYPGYEFKLVDALVTNFHLPKSTLLMLVSAFAGMELTRRAYEHAVHARYRFFSYGDAMFINR